MNYQDFIRLICRMQTELALNPNNATKDYLISSTFGVKSATLFIHLKDKCYSFNLYSINDRISYREWINGDFDILYQLYKDLRIRIFSKEMKTIMSTFDIVTKEFNGQRSYYLYESNN